MSTFQSYNWTPDCLETRELQGAFECLIDSDANLEQRVAAFGKMLRSEDIAAQGIAFDHFSHFETEIGGEHEQNPYLMFHDELLRRAREQLERPPVPSCSPAGVPVDAANHASALQVFWRIGEDSDIDHIAAILDRSKDSTVLWTACMAARAILLKSHVEYDSVIACLARMIHDTNLAESVRCCAVQVFENYAIPAARGILLHALEQCSYPVSGYAAFALCQLDLEQYRDILQLVAAGWAPDAGFPACEVREILGAH